MWLSESFFPESVVYLFFKAESCFEKELIVKNLKLKTPNSDVSVKDQVAWFWPVWKCNETCSSFRVLGWVQYFCNLWLIAFSFLKVLYCEMISNLKKSDRNRAHTLLVLYLRSLVLNILPHLFICFCSICVFFFPEPSENRLHTLCPFTLHS